MSDRIIVSKLNLAGEETVRYPARVLEHTPEGIVVEAFFGRERMELDYVTFKPGDRLVEYFYGDRWYNVFVLYDVEDAALKGWYCNITRPAEIAVDLAGPAEGHIRAVDLALDYFVQPSGREFILDEAEFAALPLSADEAARARAALAELRDLAARRAGPFGHQ